MKFIERIPQKEVLDLKKLIPFGEEQIISKTLVQRSSMGMTLFSLDKNQEIATHRSNGDAMVNILSGTALIKIADETYTVTAGESIVMPATIPHSLFAVESFQMLLVVVKPENKGERK
ncbi:cupin domain-containing protein [Enterococcus camelliae]|uniref:Cupin domain-containing protein n=1 Tax=Enterococcus camelliae TaxID=453959 RepID=A0ABW5TIQ6_9ENTE